ncbi:uncharacterized protein LOC123545377 [Mercenaria mercenaria]|uniref:uncharacterized protein LOC123545377 n=1 Tax=Mercenaria mercenaria TaxID=6596 RepID=UPI001E1D30D2|nr:uncharacterized protein LOC123545377 [Mercenaria mercenaria]
MNVPSFYHRTCHNVGYADRYVRGYEYLVKWVGYDVSEATWEPECHLSATLISHYVPPSIEDHRLRHFSLTFERAVQARLKSKNPTVVMCVDLDIYRYVFGESTKLCELNDFSLLDLPDYWCYSLNKDGTGRKLKFPIKLTVRLNVRKMYVKEDGKLTLKFMSAIRLH